MVDKPGIYEMSLEEYHQDPAPVPSFSRSVAKDLLYKSPAHAWFNHPRLNPAYKDEVSEKFDFGSAAHELLLQPADNIAVIDADDWRTKAAKEEREEARKDGKTPLLTHQYEKVKRVIVETERQIIGCSELGISDLMVDGKAELSYFWQEGDTWLKCRPDWISADKKLILDFKFTEQSANPSEIARHIISMGYDIQNALYVRGAKAINGIEPKFVFVFVELSEPYLCSFIGLPPEFLAMGKSKIEYGIHIWETCISINVWPGYPSRIAWVDCPPWAITAWESRASELGVGK